MLTNEQARENLKKYGPNELEEGKKKSVFQIFLEQFKDFLVIILIISAVISGFLRFLKNKERSYPFIASPSSFTALEPSAIGKISNIPIGT